MAVFALASVTQLVGPSSCSLKGHEFDSWSGCVREGNQSMFLTSHIHVSLSFSLSAVKNALG